MGKAGSILNLNRDENHMIFKYVFEFRLQICRSQDPPVFKLSHMATIMAIIMADLAASDLLILIET